MLEIKIMMMMRMILKIYH